MEPKDCRIVIEAGELRPDAPLRKACEKAKSAVAIACYADTERDLARLIDDELRAADLRIAPDARAALSALLGGDRQASRNEIRKLALYAHGRREVTLDDVAAVVTDASGLALDPIVDSAFAGRAADVDTAFAKSMAAGIHPGLVIARSTTQAAALHKARLLVDEGRSESEAVESAFPRCTSRARHWSRRRCARPARHGWRAPSPSLRKPPSTCAGSRHWRRRPRSARCCRSQSMHGGGGERARPTCLLVSRTRCSA